MFWIIFCIILLIILIFIFSPIGIYIEYINSKFQINLKYLFFRKKLKKDNKSVKKNERKSSNNKKEKKAEKSNKNSDKTLSEKIDSFQSILKSSGKIFRKITKHIKITGIFIDFIISDLDAYECALKFGKINIIVYNILSYLGQFVKLRKKSINIKCIYNQPESKYDLKFKISITPASLIMIAVIFIFSFLVNNKKTVSKAETVKKM